MLLQKDSKNGRGKRFQRPKYPGLQKRLYAFSQLALIAIGAYLLQVYSRDGSLTIWHGMLASVAGGFIGYAGLVAGKKARVLANLEPATEPQNSQAPVVYLRSFKDDAVGDQIPFDTAFIVSSTEEEQVAEAVKAIGPMIAFGRPDEQLPQVGAGRMYVPHPNWQRQARELISTARLVLIRAGTTPGIWWELEQAKTLKQPHEVVILLPYAFDQKYFFTRFEELFDKNLIGEIRLWDFWKTALWFRAPGSLRGLIDFEEGWTPRYRSFAPPPFLRGRYSSPVTTALHYCLEPVFKRLRVPWQPMPKSYFDPKLLVMVCMVLMALLAPIMWWIES